MLFVSCNCNFRFDWMVVRYPSLRSLRISGRCSTKSAPDIPIDPPTSSSSPSWPSTSSGRRRWMWPSLKVNQHRSARAVFQGLGVQSLLCFFLLGILLFHSIQDQGWEELLSKVWKRWAGTVATCCNPSRGALLFRWIRSTGCSLDHSRHQKSDRT